MLDTASIAAIRSKLAAIGCVSQSSTTFQNQLLTFVELNSARGDFVLELGCFRGGLTAQLAYLTSQLGKKLYVVDIDQSNLDCAAQAVKEATGSIPNSTHFFRGGLESFLSQPRISDRCIVAFVDADHSYDAVVKDIQALLNSHFARPLSIAFHDFALRCDQDPSVGVDRAIRDTLKNQILVPIGHSYIEPSSAQERALWYAYDGGSEGVLITVPPRNFKYSTSGRSRIGLGSLLGRLRSRKAYASTRDR